MRVGNAPVSWGVYEAEGPNPPWAEVLDGIARAGYDGTELGPYGYLPTDPATLARELAARSLSLGSSFVPLPLDDPARRGACVERALAVARLLASQGVRELIVADDEDPRRAKIAGRVPTDGSAGWDGGAWREAVATLHAVARAVGDRLGVRVVVHHHAGTFVETEAEIDRLLAETEADLVGLLVDSGHSVYGGGDPVALVRRHGRRVRYVHLKDARKEELEQVRRTSIPMAEAWARGLFCPLGEGVVDFGALVEALRSGGYDGWLVVEQDVVPGDDGRPSPPPFESAVRSRAYLRDAVGL